MTLTKKIKLNKRLKASFTIELALVFPFILSVIVIIIYLAFYLHDKSVLSSAAYSAAIRGSQMINGEDIETQVNSYSEKLIDNRLLATTNITTKISVTKNSVNVEYSGTLIVPAGTILCKALTGGKSSIPVLAHGTSKINNPVNFIRECRFIENAADTIKK